MKRSLPRPARLSHSLSGRSTAGFTLTEVIIVIVFIGILFAIAAPSWVTFTNNSRANAARDQVLQTLRQAQSEAKSRRTPRTVTFAGTGTSPSTPPTVTLNNDVQPISTANNVTLTINPATVSSIQFGVDGALPAAAPVPITITVTANASTRCLVIETLLGATRLLSRGETGCPPT